MVPNTGAKNTQPAFNFVFHHITHEQTFAKLRKAQQAGTFTNIVSLPMMTPLINSVGEAYAVNVHEPDTRAHIHLQPEDEVIVVRYSGRKLYPDDKQLPYEAALTFFSMKLVLTET
jgi:hypothetical protein